MKSLKQRFQEEHTGTLLIGLVILGLMTYLSYGIAGGIQNRLSQNPLLIAVLFGIFIGNVFGMPKIMKPAIDFTVAYLIKAGVILVGLKISAQVIVSLGWGPVLVAVGELVTIYFFAFFFLSKVMKFDTHLSVLLAAGCAVCGAAAVLAMALVIKSNQRNVTLSVTMVTLMGTIQLFIYPFMYHQGFFSEYTDQLFGIFIGASIFEVAQVYGAGYAVSDTAINFGTLVKLIKVMMLVPMIFIAGHYYHKDDGEQVTRAKLPVFILLFIAMVAINSLWTINATVKFVLGQSGSFLFLMAMVALGLKTDLRNIVAEHNVKKLVIVGVLMIVVTTIVAHYYTIATTLNLQVSEAENKTAFIVSHQMDEDFYGGREVFFKIGCNKCHVESMMTRTGEPVLLYSDLLIHDMGPALDDKITQGLAIGTDWRTPPLIGIADRKSFLHDGRAQSYRDAIIMHGGEAQIVRDRFIDLSEKEKQDVYKFLDSLRSVPKKNSN